VVLRPGSVIDARRIGLLAAAGHASVVVHPRPRVAVLSTGAELVEPGAALRPGQIYDSNSHLLAAAVEAAGARTAYRGHVGDDPEQVRALIDRLAGEVDVVVTSGGVSMGVHDVVKAVLRERPGVEFVTVAMQPGRPQGFGWLQPEVGGVAPGLGGDRDGGRQVPFFGLPGNPVSAFVSFEMFVRPLLRRLAGREPATRATVRSRLVTPLRSPAGRLQVARARIELDAGGGLLASPVAGQGSHFVADLADADALLLVPAEVTQLQVGDEVETILLDGDLDGRQWLATANGDEGEQEHR
ncbi:MAG: gephyrin-like molybdotransferase Glp, partial [Candidatus Phosphoribacter sp.]